MRAIRGALARDLPWLESIAGDTRYAVRQFRRTPLATLTMLLVLSLGIGTNVVLFTLVSSVATMPAPGIERDESLVRIRGTVRTPVRGDARSRLLSWSEVEAYRGLGELFLGVAAQTKETGLVTTGGERSGPIVASVIYTTPDYFRLLDVHPALGGPPPAGPDLTRMADSPAAVVSHSLWMRELGGTPDVIGRVVRINDVPVEIVGVMPERFLGTGGSGPLALWVPLAAYPVLQKSGPDLFRVADGVQLTAFARLRPGVTRPSAEPAVAAIAARIHRDLRAGAPAGRDETGGADVVPLLASNERIGDPTDLLVSGSAAVGLALLVLLITCTNVSALLAGLAGARRREIGVRLSLGAPRARLLRQLLTESVVLALAAAAVCLAATSAAVRLLGSAFRDVQLVVDWRVTAATCAIAVVSGVLFGLGPALHATRVTVGAVLEGASVFAPARRSRLQRALVVVQVALTQPLLVGLGVVIMTLGTDVGHRGLSRVPGEIAEIELDTWSSGLSPAERAVRIEAVVDRVAAMPGVETAMPMQMGTITAPLTVHPADRIPGVTPDLVMESRLTAAPEGYFGALEIPIVLGRDFDAAEHAHDSHDPFDAEPYRAVVLGSDLARRLWGSARPLGRRLTLALADGSRDDPMVVVGVVDAAAAGPSEVHGLVRVYVPYSPMNTGVIARTAGPALPWLPAMRRAVAAEAPRMPITRVQTMEGREAETHREVRRAAAVVAGGGALALLLSAIALYAAVSFAVGQRRREIGIRAALGARRRQVVRMFFLKGLGLSALGLALGLPASLLVTQWIESALDWPLASSPWLGAAIGATVLAVASVAAWLPARRASRLDPVVALRTD